MQAFNTLAPVFFMLFLGFLTRQKGWITVEQKVGANAFIFTVLFPIMIFHLMMTADIKLSALPVVLYIFIMFQLATFVGKLMNPFVGKSTSHFAHFLMPTTEGGSVALPLYLSIVGASSNTVIFDLAGATTAFLVIPILVSRSSSSEQTSIKSLLITAIKNPFVIAMGLGILANLLHVGQFIIASPFADGYMGIIEKATSPIVGTILFILGYDFQIDKDIIKPLSRLLIVRFAFYSLVILGFFFLFPNLMQDKIFAMAVYIYFMCPTGFLMPSLISPAYKDEKDELFSATFISLYLIVTLIVYTLVVVFIA